jgi:membrane associated rhomboid family serine protease
MSSVANLILFALAERTGRTTQIPTLIRFGALWRQLVWQGEYWRMATAMFLHIGAVHLIWNGYYGFRISAQVERAIGSWRFLCLYLASGVAGSAASVIGHNAVSAGASGALFGLIGWQIMASRVRFGSFRAMWADPRSRRELTWIGAWFAVGAFAGFDNFAHGGGLGFGLLFAWTLLEAAPSRKRRLAVTVLATSALVLLATRPLPVVHANDYALRKAYRSQDDPAAVLALTEPLLGTNKRLPALELRGQALLQLLRYREAEDAAGEVIAHDDSSAYAYVTRGEARFLLHDPAGADDDFQRAVELNPTWSRHVIESFRSAMIRQGVDFDHPM